MQDSILNEPLAIVLIILMLFLLLVIALLANVLLGSTAWVLKKQKEEEIEKKPGGSNAAIVAILTALLIPALSAQAQDVKTAVQAAVKIGGLSPRVFYFMIAVVGIELLVILVLLIQLRLLFWKQKERPVKVVAPAAAVKTIWNKLNKFRPVEQEADLDLGHEYDGIRELDNRLPPWWLYGFYVTIVFGVIYLWRYHVSETAPLSGQEYAVAMQHAEEEKAAYLKRSANNVDESTVTLLADPEAIATGKKLYDLNCAPCHGMSAEGTVGPNLTDDYWLHGGSLSDIFKSVKYGWPEKGMRSWKEDLSPSQISQVTSYIKSLHGTNPANAKEKQGELFQETAAPANNQSDSSNRKIASAKKLPS
jgi:cytochrome c oxidase cbb3-type subunit III